MIKVVLTIYDLKFCFAKSCIIINLNDQIVKFYTIHSFFNLYNQDNINLYLLQKFEFVYVAHTISEAGPFEFESEKFFVLRINDNPLERKT